MGARLRALCCRYDQLRRLSSEKMRKQRQQYADKFKARAIRWGKEDTVFDALADEIDVDTLVNEAVGVQEQAPKKRKTAQKEKGVWRCENKFCKDYGKEFKYISQKVRHDGSSSHVNAKGPKK